MGMARRPRNEIAGGIYHVYARGVDRQAIFRDDVDRFTYLKILGRVVKKRGWRCLAYCLMDNHIHLLIETRDANLSRGMQELHGSFGSAHNARHGRVGHVFQGRFGTTLVTADSQLWAVVAYLIRNPVEAGLCDRPENWRWSSHRAALNGNSPAWLDVPRLLSYFDSSDGDARTRYAELIAFPHVGTEGSDPD